MFSLKTSNIPHIFRMSNAALPYHTQARFPPVHDDWRGEYTHDAAEVAEHGLLLVKVGADPHRLRMTGETPRYAPPDGAERIILARPCLSLAATRWRQLHQSRSAEPSSLRWAEPEI